MTAGSNYDYTLLTTLASLGVIAVLLTVHYLVPRWRFLNGPRAPVWLSISSGTALAYVFIQLLPKLATVQSRFATQLDDSALAPFRHHAYLLALAGLVTFFLLDRSVRHVPLTESALTSKRTLAFQIVGFSLYNLQVGYLIADLPVPGVASYVLIALVFGLHLMGVDHHLWHHGSLAYEKILRWCFIAATLLGWTVGILTHALESVVILVGTFVAGGVMILAIREELPDDRRSSPVAFVIAVCTASLLIIVVQNWQST